MSPTLPEILRGCFVALATPPTEAQGGPFLQARIGTIALLNFLAAQEAERCPFAEATEEREIAALLDDARAAGYWVAAMTHDNAALRRALMDLHEEVEARGDTALDRRILGLYRRMAEARQLDLP